MSVPFELAGRKIWVAGERGMVGSAIVRALRQRGLHLVSPEGRVDLRRQADVEELFATLRPEVVFLAAARVGGILANSRQPVDFLYDNLMIESNVIAAAHANKVAKLMFLGSTCIYPRLAPQPLREDSLLTGPLEPTNQWYAVAKIAGIKLCQAYRTQYGADFISALPTNLYGPHDNFDLSTSHVLPALLRKVHDAKQRGAPTVTVWGTGTPRREFMHVDDLARALLFLAEHYSALEPINVGTGQDLAISELAATVARVVGYSGGFVYDFAQPDGTPIKRTDCSKLFNLGFQPSIGLEEGLEQTYSWFKSNQKTPT